MAPPDCLWTQPATDNDVNVRVGRQQLTGRIYSMDRMNEDSMARMVLKLLWQLITIHTLQESNPALLHCASASPQMRLQQTCRKQTWSAFIQAETRATALPMHPLRLWVSCIRYRFLKLNASNSAHQQNCRTKFTEEDIYLWATVKEY